MKKIILSLALIVMFSIPLVSSAGASLNGSSLGCAPYLDTVSVGELVTVSLVGKNIPKSQINSVTWYVPYSGSITSGTGLTFNTSFTEPGFFIIGMHYKGEFAGVCAFNVI